MSEVKKVAIIINSAAINYNIGIISLLLKKYGGEHSIIVRKKMITHGVINFITTLISIILSPIIFPYYMIKDYYKEKNEIE